MTVVIDASITIAALSPDERNDDRERDLDTIAVNDVVVPTAWTREVIHELRRKVARAELSAEMAMEALAAAQLLNVRASSTSAPAAFSGIGRLDRNRDLTPYDAACLDCAIRLERPLATPNHRLRAAPLVEGIALLPD